MAVGRVEAGEIGLEAPTTERGSRSSRPLSGPIPDAAWLDPVRELERPAFDGHEAVLRWHDPDSDLVGIVAIHSRALGPAVGGCRFWHYASESEALDDVLRLSRGMTYKNALADLPFGGGKAVLLAPPDGRPTAAQLRAFGRFVDALGGAYITAEDVGIGVHDIETIAQETDHVAGRVGGTAGGDPSPRTAYGVFLGLRAAVRHRLGREELRGLRVAVQGLGSVGRVLCEQLARAGASLVVADPNADAVARIVASCGARGVDPDAIFDADVDVFSPCALGGVLDDETIGRLQAVVVAGAANNQLAEPRHAALLRQRGILYAPDYLINAGGIINIGVELQGAYDECESRRQIEQIEDRAAALFRRAEAEGRTTLEIADALVRERLALADAGPGVASANAATGASA